MKRFFSYIGASLVAIAALSSCSKEIDNPSNEASNGIQFAITASSVDTKTSIDGFKTSWVANDKLDITHAIAGSTKYITDGSFSISEANLATNKFNGTLKSNLEEGSSYNWYALYPYTEKNYTYIGHSKGAIQNGNNSTAHLCGTLCPLYGVAKNVNSSDPVSFDMQHLAAVVEITVTNETDADLTVKNITFASSDENIVGSYIIDFKGDNVTYAASDEQYVSKVATLNVTNGDAIAKNGSAKFYIPIKPHIAEAGSKIVINVNGYEKEIPLTKDVTFKAGTVKKIGFKYDTKSTLYKIEFNSTNTRVTKVDASTKASTFVIAGAEYLEAQPFSNPSSAYYGGDTSNGLPLRIGKSDANGSITMALSKNGQINANKIIISAKQYTKGKTFCIGVNDSAKQKPGENYTDLEFALDGSPLTSIKLDSDGYIYVQSITYLSAPVDNTTPSLSVDQTSKVWAADATDAFVVNVTVNSEGGDWNVTPESLSWATIAVDKTAGTITVTPNGANETETANEATITVAHASEASLTKEITLKQNGAGGAADIKTATLIREDIVKLGKLAYATEKTLTKEGFTWSFTANKDTGSRPWAQIKKDKASYVKLSAPKPIKKVQITITSAQNSKGGIEDISKHTPYSGDIHLKTADIVGNSDTNDVAKTSMVTNNIATLVPTGSNTELYIKVSAGARIWGISVDY